MRYHALVTDYDDTLAHEGRVSEETVSALERLRASGRRLILVTGREVDDLGDVFDRLDLFDLVVAENGAVLFDPDSRDETVLCERAAERFVRALRDRGVSPLSVGRVIVATREPNQTFVLETISDLGLELEIIFNEGAVMVLPSGVNKATGLAAALAKLRLSAHNAVGIGDAQNDHAFMSICEASVAVANALPAVKERADLVTEGEHGEGVIELIEALLDDDLARLDERLGRRDRERQRVRPAGEPTPDPCGDRGALRGRLNVPAGGSSRQDEDHGRTGGGAGAGATCSDGRSGPPLE